MRTRVLLVNFTDKEAEKLKSLNVDVQLGYLSDAYTVISHDEGAEEEASFYSPLAIYEYNAVFIKLTSSPPLKNNLGKLAKTIDKKSKLDFFKYWYEGKGIMTIFAEDCSFTSLENLGFPSIGLVDSSGNDKTVFFSLKQENRPLLNALRELESSIVVPTAKYIELEKKESDNSGKKWVIFTSFMNRNDERIGIHLNWGYYFSDVDSPAFVILPKFKNYPEAIEKLLKAYARIDPDYFSDICDLDWTKSDKYYPKRVLQIEEEVNSLILDTENKIKALRVEKTKEKEKYDYLRNLLIESGDSLKRAVIKTLVEVFGLKVTDMDEINKSDLKEDILIESKICNPILAEIKGTKNSYPSFTYVAQTLSNLLKERDKFPNAIGGLILNMDRGKDPNKRSNAYTKVSEEKQLKEILFLDTRVIFKLAIAVIDSNFPIDEAKKILLIKGRATFDIKQNVDSLGKKGSK